jgi:hypothetical protein
MRTLRQKKPIKLAHRTKTVKIDERTSIEVSVSISDEDARERFWLRNKTYPHPKPVILYPKEIPINDISELEELMVERDEGEIETE